MDENKTPTKNPVEIVIDLNVFFENLYVYTSEFYDFYYDMKKQQRIYRENNFFEEEKKIKDFFKMLYKDYNMFRLLVVTNNFENRNNIDFVSIFAIILPGIFMFEFFIKRGVVITI